jgi:hypothetical protein
LHWDLRTKRVKDATTDRKKNPVEKNKMFDSCNRKGLTAGHARVIHYGLKALTKSFKLVDFCSILRSEMGIKK